MNIIAHAESLKQRKRRVRAQYWLPTQERWIKSKRRKKLMQKTRRYGGSFCNSYSVAEKVSRKGNPFDAWVGSRDLLAARLSINDIKFFTRVLKTACQDRGEIILDDDKKLRAFEIEFGNGRFARALSSSPDSFAGKQGWITLDEYALHKQPRQLYGIVQPGLMRGGGLGIISTHRGTANHFNELVKEIVEKGNPKDFELFTINIEQAVEEGLWLKIQQGLEENEVDDERLGWTDDEFLQSLRAECATDEMWNQEYMCIPCDDSAALLTWELILQASCTELEMRLLLADVPLSAPRYIGMDIGRKNHPSVIWQWVEWKGLLIEEEVEPLLNMPFAKQEQALFARLERLPVVAAKIDATGLGMQLAENAATKFPTKAQGVIFQQGVKTEMAVRALRRFQDGQVRMRDDTKRQYELYSLKQRSGSGDKIIITEDASFSEKHSDYAWAAFLGLSAREHEGAGFGYSTIGQPDESMPGGRGFRARLKRALGL